MCLPRACVPLAPRIPSASGVMLHKVAVHPYAHKRGCRLKQNGVRRRGGGEGDAGLGAVSSPPPR